jgi:hypothetical protein
LTGRQGRFVERNTWNRVRSASSLPCNGSPEAAMTASVCSGDIAHLQIDRLHGFVVVDRKMANPLAAR